MLEGKEPVIPVNGTLLSYKKWFQNRLGHELTTVYGFYFWLFC